MKYFVYVILAEKYDKIYIGITGNLEMRLFAHNNLPKGWTKNFRPWKLVYSEVFSTKAEAFKREKELKSHTGRTFIRQQILNKNKT
jgi:putative endonuclease